MRCRRILGAGILSQFAVAVALLPVVAVAQDVTEPALKAAFIYNFAKFTEWPADGTAVTFAMCVLGDVAVREALERAVAGRAVGGHRIVVSQVAPADPKRSCRILYLSGVTATQASQLIADVRDELVLTISDVDGFTDVGGIAEFFFEQGQLRFRIHLESATRARLQISSRLLVMARSK